MIADVLITWIKDNWKRQEGQTMAEYGVILALIAVVVIGTMAALGTSVKDKIGAVVTGLGGALPK
jgi:pilus assembly protein Flp/PilA